MENIFVRWDPLDDIPETLNCEGIHDDYEGFRILLKDAGGSGAVLRIKFDFLRSYRKSDEGDLLKTISNNRHIGKSTLFLVENSSYVNWFHEETIGIHLNRVIKHYAIYTSNDCIDVLSDAEPIVEWLN